MTKQLYASRGCGSICVEAVLQLLGLPYERIELAPWSKPEDAEQLRPLNPLLQVPTLVLDDGSVLTETVAILLWLEEQHPAAGLLPPVGTSARALQLRGLVFLAAAIYTPLVMADTPPRWVGEDGPVEDFKARVQDQLDQRWRMFEAQVAALPGPHLNGARLGLLDIYAAMMARWSMARGVIAADCPRVAAAVALAGQEPVLARLWAAQF